MNTQNGKIIDISCEMLSQRAEYETEPRLETVSSMENGDEINSSRLVAPLNSGTHISAPKLCIENGKSIDEYDLSRFTGPCRVVKAKGILTGAWIEQMSLYKCEKLLIKSAGKGKIDISAAEEIVAQGVKLIGIDSRSIGIENQNDEVKRILLENDCLILEGLNLEEAEMDNYFLFSQPLSLYSAEAAPCRALLVSEYLYWNKK